MNYSKLPEHMQYGAKMYIEHGVEPGGFLFAVLCNDLVEAFGRADGENQEAMRKWAQWLYKDCPRNAWGSEDKVNAWMDHRGLNGLKP